MTDETGHRPSGEEFTRWAQTIGLTAEQVGRWANAKIVPGVGAARARLGEGPRTTQCDTVRRWMAGTTLCTPNTWTLLQAKGVLFMKKMATFEELAETPFHTLLETILRSVRS